MRIIVGEHKVKIQKEIINEKEIDITKCKFEFEEPITEEYVKNAYFTFNGVSYKVMIINNECSIPYEVLSKKGVVEIGVVAYLLDNNVEVKRYNPSPAYFDTFTGSLKDSYENTKPITPSDKEQMEQAIQDMEVKMDNLDIDAEKVGTTATITITKKDGTTKSVDVNDGDSGIVVFSIVNGHLIGTSENATNLTNYSIQNGHLYLTIEE